MLPQIPKKAACFDDGLALFFCGGFPGTPTSGNLPTGEEVTLFVYRDQPQSFGVRNVKMNQSAMCSTVARITDSDLRLMR